MNRILSILFLIVACSVFAGSPPPIRYNPFTTNTGPTFTVDSIITAQMSLTAPTNAASTTLFGRTADGYFSTNTAGLGGGGSGIATLNGNGTNTTLYAPIVTADANGQNFVKTMEVIMRTNQDFIIRDQYTNE